jgi:hypothetical protein
LIHACSIGKECFKLQYLQCKWTHSLFMWAYIDNLTCSGCLALWVLCENICHFLVRDDFFHNPF